MLLNLILFLISCIVLIFSGGWLVKSLSRIAIFLRLSDFVVASIIMAFSTSIPELFVGINAAIAKIPILSLGNVIGSNIADLTIVIGIAALLGKGILIKETNVKEASMLLFILATTPLILMGFGNELSRLDGFVLVTVFIAYTYYLLKKKTKPQEDKNNAIMGFFEFFNNILLFMVSLAILFGSSYFVVKYAELLSIDLGIPEILIGLFLIALGTSLPELIFETRAVLNKKGEMSLGDSMGSVICNSTLVLGVTALIYPITDGITIFITSSIYLLFIIIMFILFIRNKNLSWKKALFLLLFYIGFLIMEFFLKY